MRGTRPSRSHALSAWRGPAALRNVSPPEVCIAASPQARGGGCGAWATVRCQMPVPESVTNAVMGGRGCNTPGLPPVCFASPPHNPCLIPAPIRVHGITP